VAQIAERNGMRVASGDLLVRSDGDKGASSLQVVSKQIDEARELYRGDRRARRPDPDQKFRQT